MATVSVVASQVWRSGGVVGLYLGFDPPVGVESRAFVTALNSVPTFQRNGSPLNCWLQVWGSTGNKNLPWVAFLFNNGTSPVIFDDDDVITWTALSGWCTTWKGAAPAQSGTCTNFTGGYEDGVFGYYGFDWTGNPRTFKPGFQGNGALANVVYTANVLHKTSNPWTGAASSTTDGYPLTFTSSGVMTATVWDSTSNGIDNRKYPTPIGKATLTATETNPSSPIVAELIGAQASLITGPTITGTGVGKKWEWQVALGAGTYNNSLTLRLTAPSPHSAGQAQTLTDMQLCLGDDDPPFPITPEEDASANYLAMLTVAPGVSASVCRYLSNWPTSSVARPSDILDNDAFSYRLKAPIAAQSDPTFTGPRTLPIYRVRPYDLTVSPNVYMQEPNQWTVASDNTNIAPYMVVPANHGLAYDWLFQPGGTTKGVIYEMEFALSDGTPVVHNLISMQYLTLPAFTFNCFNSAGSGTAASLTPASIWVTGSNKVALYCLSNLTAATDLGKCTSPQLISGNKVATFNPGTLNYCTQGATSIADGDPAVWVCLNARMTDAAVLKAAQELRAGTAVGTTVYVQLSNEPFIASFESGAWQQLAAISGFGYNNTPECYTQRSSECWAIFETIWGVDEPSLQRVFQPHTFTPGNTVKGLTYADTNSIKIDAIAVAPYENVDVSPSFLMAEAAVVADSPDSIANPAQGGQGILTTWPIVHDLDRHYYKYNRIYNGPPSGGTSGIIQAQITARNNTHYGQGAFSYPMPRFVMYEGGFGETIAAGPSHTTKTVRAGLSTDWRYAPTVYEVAQALFQHLNTPGPIGSEGITDASLVQLCGPGGPANTSYVCPDGPDNLFAAQWVWFEWQGQQRGYGLSNQFWADNGQNNAWQNEAVLAQSAADWILAASPPVVFFTVTPDSIFTGVTTLLTLIGTSTTWTSGSTVTVTNSLSGTTAVSAGTFTALSSISATLQVSAGSGVGTWRVTIDGVDSQPLSTSAPAVRRRWLPALGRPRGR